MLGAIAGDIVGSVYEWHPIKTTGFPLFRPDSFFTDDTVMTIAVAQVILERGDYAKAFRDLGCKYPDSGYGGRFGRWLFDPQAGPYNSWGNGSAMRVCPVGFAFNSVEEVLREAERSAVVTHNHPEGVKGAQATALAILMARQGQDKEAIRQELAARFGYDLCQTVESIRPGYTFDESCQGTVPQALIAFFDSTDYEDAIRKAVSLGGDADTLACITGGIAQAYYGELPASIVAETRSRLPAEFLQIVDRFGQAYPM